jgi:hypothetical protein|nr:MAG TPA: hypothetical protein [Bacteriophage sp.]
MAKKISFGLSVSEINRAIKELQSYQNSLDSKCQQLCERLCNEGIQIAQAHIGSSGFGKYIRLSSEISPEKAGCKAIFFMEDSQKIISQWQNQDGEQSKEISPALMLEFGAGLPAQNPVGIPGVGTGTYGTHGKEPVWWYMDLQGDWHYSTGVTPKMPMYNAGKELRDKVVAIAKEVFK